MPALAVLTMAVAAQWEGTQPTTRGLASAVTSPSSLRADQAPHGYTEKQTVAAWWEHAYAEPSGGNAGSPPSALLPQPERVVIAGLSRFESGPQPTYFGESARNSNLLTADVQNLQTAALAALDARDHPGTTEAIVTAAATGRVQALGGSLSEAEMGALLEVTGWPIEWRAEAKAIAWCESKYSPGASGDGGNSLGLWQLWYGWFAPAGYSVEQAYDPVTNSRVALYVRTTRGRWGGGGGWSCADLLGIE